VKQIEADLGNVIIAYLKLGFIERHCWSVQKVCFTFYKYNHW